MTSATDVLISRLEIATLELRLALTEAKEIKSALQVLCGYLERGRVLADQSSIAPKLIPLIFEPDVQVRRWTYKAIALLKNASAHAEPLISRILLADPDPENMTWAICALFAIAPPAKLNELIEQKKLPMDDTVSLAARLYRVPDKSIVKDPKRSIRIDTADPLTLRWVCLLTGYGIAVPKLFPKDYTGKTIIPQLNGHNDASVAEYSIWALWQNPAFSIDQIAIKKPSFTSQPPNVRRWINRLITKRPEDFEHELDLIVELSRDEEERARSGLALGLAPHYVHGLDKRIAEWCAIEQSEGVRTTLLEHMASKCSLSSLYHEIVLDRYKREKTDSMLRKRLEAAAERTPLNPELKAVSLSEGLPTDMFGTGFSAYIQIKGDLIMGNKQTIQGGRDVSVGVNIGSGNNYGDVKTSIEQSATTAQQKAQLAFLLEALNGHKKQEDVQDAIATIDALAKTPSPSNLEKLKNALAKVKDVAGAASAVGDAISSTMDAINSWTF